MTAAGWKRLAEALSFYGDYGFHYLEMPWEARDVFANATSPEGGHAVRLVSTLPSYSQEGHQLVASAEQALIQYLHGQLFYPERIMALTPCFRSEPHLDELRRPYFMKLELCRPTPWEKENKEALVGEITQVALRFFFSQFALGATVVATPEADGESAQGLITRFSRDIVVPVPNAEPIELGSYGFRSWTHPDGTRLQWVYGTGLAEPRFSSAMALNGV